MLADDPRGLRCEAGGFFIDPLAPVERAVVTHAHGDHARPGSAAVLCAAPCAPLIARRLEGARIETLEYGEKRRVGEVEISFHPSGHMLGAAQVRLEGAQGVWVVSGDYKRELDPTCPPLEPQRCDVFVSEATYALPIFRWDDPALVAQEILRWWEGNPGASILYCYALGKAQRILGELARLTDQPAYAHGSIERVVEAYRAQGVRLLPTLPVAETARGKSFAGQLVLAPITARGTPWMKRFRGFEEAFASGMMRIRGTRRRRAFDRGFALSDHADWSGVLRTIRETGAGRVFATHGHHEALVRYLREEGVEAASIGQARPPDPEGD